MRLADLMSPVDIAEDFTLGDLCRVIETFDEMDVEAFSALLQCPLRPFLAECLWPSQAGEPASELHYLRVAWECEYELPMEDRWPPETSLHLCVDAIGETWKDCRPGGPAYEEGKDYRNCNRYGIDLTPLHALRHLPVRIAPVMVIWPFDSEDAGRDRLEVRAPDVTLLQCIHALFWEFSFFGTPEQRDTMREELRRRKERIDTGEERLIPAEEIDHDEVD